MWIYRGFSKPTFHPGHWHKLPCYSESKIHIIEQMSHSLLGDSLLQNFPSYSSTFHLKMLSSFTYCDQLITKQIKLSGRLFDLSENQMVPQLLTEVPSNRIGIIWSNIEISHQKEQRIYLFGSKLLKK